MARFRLHFTVIFTLIITLTLSTITCTEDSDLNQTFPVLSGPYLGQEPPGSTPELFAPGIVADIHHEHSPAVFSPNGNEVFWTVAFIPLQSPIPGVIMHSQLKDGHWTEPAIAPFSGKYNDDVSSFSPSGDTLFFSSQRPLPGEEQANARADIWFVERESDGWAEPIWLDAPVNTEYHESDAQLTRKGNMYFVGHLENVRGSYGIFRSALIAGQFTDPIALGPQINSEQNDWCPYVDPDERFLIFSSNRSGGFGGLDLYVSFARDDGSWREPVNLGATINSEDNDRFPAVSPDGRYLFFLSKRTDLPGYFKQPQTAQAMIEMGRTITNGLSNIYWVDAAFLEQLPRDHVE